jgi:protein O-GlcNAc transferase
MATVFEAFAIAIQHHQAGRLQAAEQIYRQILQVDPTHADSWHLLGVINAQEGRHRDAVEYIARALDLRPQWAEAQANMGHALRKQGKPDEAVRFLRSAVQLKPGSAEAQNNLGSAFKDLGNLDEAIACYRRALGLKPDYAAAHYNLGMAFRELGDLHGAIACYRRALELSPDDAEVWNNLGNAFKDRGDLDEAIAGYRRALGLRADYAAAHSNLLCTLHYGTGVTPATLAEAHAEYDRRHAAPLSRTVVHHDTNRPPHGRPRLGFVSPDLGRHPVGYFLVRVLENLGQEQLETICYSDRIVKDDLTHRLQAAATGWRDVIGLSHEELAGQIRADGIDILLDLAGHTAHNRLLVFARKPAPIQISWIGYEGTTGLAAMDYLLADRFVVPEGSERHYRETVLRMPDGYLCYDPPEAAPPVGPPPSLKEGFATFGSFNNPAKITPEVVAVWSRILRGAPTARLVMKYRGLGDPSVRKRFLDLFAANGVGAQRLDLLPSSAYSDYLASYHRVDVALDPFPFSGSTITCESLWMGVPVITLPGDTFASRHSLDHLSNVGLTETIARDPDEYIDLAISLAGDPSRLLALRSGLRERMAASPLCDGKRFATHLLSILHGEWERGIVCGKS